MILRSLRFEAPSPSFVEDTDDADGSDQHSYIGKDDSVECHLRVGLGHGRLDGVPLKHKGSLRVLAGSTPDRLGHGLEANGVR